MELINIDSIQAVELESNTSSAETPFILANTVPMKIVEMEKSHIIPVFVKDNEPVISHLDFISCTQEVVKHIFTTEHILSPTIRVSHPIKGRTPDAKNKAAKELLEHEKTIYYERMAFTIEIPSITETINGNKLSLMVGGVKSYGLDNLYSKKGTMEHFKIFIGFSNKVCCNLCIWSDGYIGNLKVNNISDLMKQIFELFSNYQMETHFKQLKRFENYHISDSQFATLIGRTKLYQYLNSNEKQELFPLEYGDSQISTIAKDYYFDENFSKCNESINLWYVYNLFTGANKQSYIDTFLKRSLNAYDFTNHLADSIESNNQSWFFK